MTCSTTTRRESSDSPAAPRLRLGFPVITGLGSNVAGGFNNSMGPGNANKYYNDKLTAVANVTYVRSQHTVQVRHGVQTGSLDGHQQDLLAGPAVLQRAADRPAVDARPESRRRQRRPRLRELPPRPHRTGRGHGRARSRNGESRRGASTPRTTGEINRNLTFDYGLRWDYGGQGHETVLPHQPGRTDDAESLGRRPARWVHLRRLRPGTLQLRVHEDLSLRVRAHGSGRPTSWMTRPCCAAAGASPTARSRTGGTSPAARRRSAWASTRSTGPTQRSAKPRCCCATACSLQHRGPVSGVARSGHPTLARTAQCPACVGRSDQRSERRTAGTGEPVEHRCAARVPQHLMLEAAYVGNRGVWLEANNLVSHNAIPLTRLAGARPRSQQRRRTGRLLTSRIDSALAASRGFSAPYPGYPGSATVAQSLRPFPQFNDGLAVRWAPLGSTWYDALQLNFTQRQWHGLSSTAAFTWQHERALGSGGNPSAGGGPTNNVFDRAAQKGLAANSQPFIFVTSFNYITPRPQSKVAGRAARRVDDRGPPPLRQRGADSRAPGAEQSVRAGLPEHPHESGRRAAALHAGPELPLHRPAERLRAQPGGVGGSCARAVRHLQGVLRRLPMADARSPRT